MSKYKLSIIMPVYQAESFIEETITSILSQDYENLELVLIDDGSTDRSGAICDKYAQKEQRVQVIHQSNKGPSAARNAGISSATGEYVAFVDADDDMTPNAFTEIMLEANKQKVDVILYGAYFQYYKQGQLLKSESHAVASYERLNKEGFARYLVELEKVACLTGIWKVIRRDLLISHNLYFDEQLRIYEDFQLFLRVCNIAEDFCVIPKPLYRRNIELDRSLIIKRTLPEKTYIRNMDKVREALLAYINPFQLPESDQKELNEILLRGYLYEIEVAFINRRPFSAKLEVIDSFINRQSIRYCIQQCKPVKFRMSIIHYSLLKRHKAMIYLLFLIKTFETRMRYSY